jgi:hypothetical protein
MPLALAATLDMLLLAGFAGALVLVAFFQPAHCPGVPRARAGCCMR